MKISSWLCRLKYLTRHLVLDSVAFAFVLMSTGCSSSFTDISPNQGSPTSAGLTLALAGSDASLFAVSLNAGVWHRTNSDKGQSAWTQLKGPRYANCIAVDPSSPTHVVVGEREGDAKETRLNEAGLWESFGSGSSWEYAFNPMEIPMGNPANHTFCQLQAITSVVFTATSSVIVGTPCGIARRQKGNSDFVSSTLPAGVTSISALVTGKTKVWARTPDGLLLVSTDDGKTFNAATNKPLPDGVAFTDEGDSFSLAASDNLAVMSGCCAVSGPAPVSGNNANEMIIYNVAKDTWTVESFQDAGGNTITTGTYIGGRRFVRSFATTTGSRFFFCNSQAVWEVDLAGKQTLIASSGIDVPTPTTDLYKGSFHSDLWDFGLSTDGKVMWIACDGGVYENRLDNNGWTPSFDGLHTLHVQSLDVVNDPAGTQIGFATQDNGAWYGRWPAWNQTGVANSGDVNASDADAGAVNEEFFFQGMNSFILVPLDGVSPQISSATAPRSVIIDSSQPDVPGLVQFIQSTKTETDVPLDAYILVQRPVNNRVNPPNPILPPTPALAGIGQSGNPWLLRNRAYKNELDFYRQLVNGNLVKELDDLPDGTVRVLTSGGHTNTHYFAIVKDGVGHLSLFERRHLPKTTIPKWISVFSGIIEWTNRCAGWEGWYGPVYVNPYDPSKVYLLANDGVKVSHRDKGGNLIFRNDDILTQLITASSTYPITRQVCGGNPANVEKANRVLGASTLGHVSFFKEDPSKIIVASPFTGVFYDNGDKLWRSFSNILPQAPVWAVRLDKNKAYIGFAGRSVGMVNDPGDAALATYFTRENAVRPQLGGQQTLIAKLWSSDGKSVGGNIVSARITAVDGTTKFWAPTLHLDNQG